jgi:DNA-binding winged helix-turn-helix (wHTH) protein/tetratricopeptide (TPR) repeat protein
VRYSFGEYTIDRRAYSLSRAGQNISVRPKVFDVLCYLIENRARVVGKQELLDAIWREPFVDEFAVPWTVSHVRRALDQERGAQHPIQTVRGRGYRFVADVAEQADDLAPVRGPVRSHAEPPREVSLEHAGLTQEQQREVDPFIGRALLMEQLGERLSRAVRGQGGTILLVGDAGMGKTRCMHELVLAARARGFLTLGGRSFEATCNPVFWPWIQILHLVQEACPAEAAVARAFESALSAEARGAAGEPTSADRYWQYDALGALLRKVAREKPLLITFDDLHWADAGTWEVLSYLGPELKHVPILIVGARREGKAARGRVRTLPQLRDAERFKLAALSLDEVSEYLRQVCAGALPEPALCALVHSISAGNPWYLRDTVDGLIVDHGRAQLAHLAASQLCLVGAASERLRLRCLALAPFVREVLEVASVLGDEFDAALVSRMSDRALEEVLDALEVACDEGLVLFTPRRARFAHGLVRSVLYEGLEIVARARLHLRAARELERSFDPLRQGELAHHYHAALPLAPARETTAACVLAADIAARAQAFGDAASFLEWASEAQQYDSEGDPRARAELFLQRATMERMAGDEGTARRSVSMVLELGRERGFADLLVSSARVLRLSFAQAALPDPLSLEALEQVLRLCPEATEERVSALSLLSWSVPNALDMECSKALSGEALTLARELGSAPALYDALHARLYALSGPDDIDALLAVADELLSLPGERSAWADLEALFASYRAHLYRCAVPKADACLRAVGAEARARGLSEALYHHDFFLAQRAFSRGDFAGSELAFDELNTRGTRLNFWQAPMLCSVAKTLLINERDGMSAVAKAQGLDALLAGLVALPPCYAAAGARLAAEAGRPEIAREMLHQLTRHDFRRVVKDLGYVNALANLAVVAIALEDREQARAIYERLAPYPGHNTPSGAIGFYEGAASRFLAALAAFLGEAEQAVRHFDDALTLNTELGALPLVARTSYEYARFLARGGHSGVSAWLKKQAIELSSQFGMQALLASARAL